MWATHTSQGCAFSSLRQPSACVPRFKGMGVFLSAPLRMTLGLGAGRNNRLVPLGGSSAHGGPFPSHPRGLRSSSSEPSSRLSPQVLQEKVLLRERLARGLSEERPAHLEAGLLVTPSALAGSPLWVGSPKDHPISHFQSPLFSICHFPRATVNPAGPLSLKELALV